MAKDQPTTSTGQLAQLLKNPEKIKRENKTKLELVILTFYGPTEKLYSLKLRTRKQKKK